jgi:hypothetical protein
MATTAAVTDRASWIRKRGPRPATIAPCPRGMGCFLRSRLPCRAAADTRSAPRRYAVRCTTPMDDEGRRPAAPTRVSKCANRGTLARSQAIRRKQHWCSGSLACQRNGECQATPYLDVHLQVVEYDAEPPLALDEVDVRVEFDLNLSSGAIVLEEPASDPVPIAIVTPGRYRLRWHGLGFDGLEAWRSAAEDDEDASRNPDHYRLELWQTSQSAPPRQHRGRPNTGT